MERGISRRDLLFNKLPRFAGLVFIAACGGDLPSQAAPEPSSTPIPSITEAKSSHGPTTIERSAIERKLSDFTRKSLDDFQKQVNSLIGKEIDIEVDKTKWMVKISKDKSTNSRHTLLDVIPPAVGYQGFQLEVSSTELSELAATGFYGAKQGGKEEEVFPLALPVSKHFRMITMGIMTVDTTGNKKARFRLEVPLT